MQEEDIVITNVYAANMVSHKYLQLLLTNIKELTDCTKIS